MLKSFIIIHSIHFEQLLFYYCYNKDRTKTSTDLLQSNPLPASTGLAITVLFSVLKVFQALLLTRKIMQMSVSWEVFMRVTAYLLELSTVKSF